ncbi:hypothetical protein DEDE109153_01135 [Deinococcus deserti]|uniref:Uncharacterized protein n=1 Tax=Deinococcus deserti (strain DSM 17065 / CIP 109153 / LMG 22923 / VCD115) TaxID=546414 RepID=C1CVL4_DEIDV|nr:hypothetical protein [Deinococcus deserti]ACO46231.1 hypothetical protein Deide_13060 [Deinococcus deserti VCD115]
MNDTTQPRATFRQWEATVTDRECGVTVSRTVYTVTLTRTVVGLQATVDGEAAPLARAVGILQAAHTVILTAQTLEAPTPPTIGKAQASKLHRLLARAGVPTGEHYGFAGAALDRAVYSLAALTETDARQVWRFLQDTHARAA